MTIQQVLQTRTLVNPIQIPTKYSRRLKNCVACGVSYLVSFRKTISKSKYCSRECSNKNQPRRYWNKGKELSVKHRRLLSRIMSGNKSPLWRGGITPINLLIRTGVEYKLWRKSVFERDDYKCVECGVNGYLNADHIKPFAYFPELRFKLSNGRTLCRECHKKTDTFAQKARNKYEN